MPVLRRVRSAVRKRRGTNTLEFASHGALPPRFRCPGAVDAPGYLLVGPAGHSTNREAGGSTAGIGGADPAFDSHAPTRIGTRRRRGTAPVDLIRMAETASQLRAKASQVTTIALLCDSLSAIQSWVEPLSTGGVHIHRDDAR